MTITEIAKLAGVSVSTVSKIVNNKDESISAETRERVMRIVREHNYRPYASVAPRQGRTGMIGVVAREHSGAMIEGLIHAAGKLGYSVLIKFVDGSEIEFLKSTSSLLEQHVDGIILECSPEDVARESRLSRWDIPAVFVNNKTADTPRIDYEALGFAATDALISRGHNSIACLIRKGSRSDGFFDGYKQCLFSHGIPFDRNLVFSAEDEFPAAKIATHAFGGVVVSHFHDALSLYRAAADLRYEIPYDLSIVSLKGGEVDYPFPTISAIKIPFRAFGDALAKTLIASIEKTAAIETFHTPTLLESDASIDIPYTARTPLALVVGSINVDNYLSFDVLPHVGASVTSPASEKFPGGKCLNEAIGVARLGISAAAIGRVGNDADADYLFESLKDSGVDTMGIKRTREQKTGQGYIFVTADGDSMITIMSGANGATIPSDIDSCKRLFPGAAFCLVNTEIPLAAAHRALELSHECGVTTILKPSAIKKLPSEMIELVDYLVPNAEELEALCPEGSTDDDRAKSLLERGAGCIIATKGAKGCTIYQPDTDPLTIPAIEVTSIDATGAGDAFIAALASYLSRGYSLHRAARIATYAAGISTTRQGAAAALVERSILESYIRQHEPDLLEP